MIAKKIIAGVLSACILTSSITIQVSAENKTKSEIPNYTKTGNVTTLVKDYDDFFLLKENYSAVGTLTEAVVKEELTEEEYNEHLAAKDYDLLQNTTITTSINGNIINMDGTNLYLVISTQTVDERFVQPSIIGKINNSYDSYSTFKALLNKADNNYSYLYSYNNNYYRVTANKTSKISIIKTISSETFDSLKNDMSSNDILFYRSVKFTDGVFSDIIYNQQNTSCVTLSNNSTDIGLSIVDVLNGEQYSDTEPASTNATSEFGANYQQWSDQFNEGYTGTWQDPTYIGDKEIVEWNDPFWSLDASTNNNESSSGYTDDFGNFIKTDKNGNVLPTVPGSFDSNGNFQPQDVTGYYDINGTYHFESKPIEGAKLSSDGKFYVENDEYIGYFETDGSWHETTTKATYTHYYDGTKISTDGAIYDPSGEYIGRATSNLWGAYFYAKNVYYPDGYVFATDTLKLTDINGKCMTASTTDHDNYSFSDGTMIVNAYNFMKGTKTSANGVKLKNGTIFYEDGTIKYHDGTVYANGYLLKNDGLKVKASFEFGKIVEEETIYFEQGLIATKDALGNYITDNDAVMLSNFRYMLSNGFILENSKNITTSYLDGNQNVVTLAGAVINRRLDEGYYDENGQFIEGIAPWSTYYYDRLGNRINSKGEIINSSNQYYSLDGSIINERPETNGYYTCDGVFISNENQILSRNIQLGYFDNYYNFILNNGTGIFDNEGVFYSNCESPETYLNNLGQVMVTKHSDFYIDENNNLYIPGYKAIYKGAGLFLSEGRTGYYNRNGRFISSEINPSASLGGFYGPNGSWYGINDFYINQDGIVKSLFTPNLGIKIIEDKILFLASDQTFDMSGITEISGVTGYYDQDGKFVKSKTSSYIGGFYDKAGTWIDSSYYSNILGNCVNNGYYVSNGSYVTPNGDYGYFDKNGTFVVNKLNTDEKGFYNHFGEFQKFSDYLYRDIFGNYKTFDKSFAITSDGSQIAFEIEPLAIENYTYIANGTFADKNGYVGYFNGETFVSGKNPFRDGFYLPNQKFINYGECADGTTFYKYYEIKNDENIKLYTNDGYTLSRFETSKTPFTFQSGKFYIDAVTGEIFYDNICHKPDGSVGYYDKNGMFNANYANPYINGFYIAGGMWIGLTSGEPTTGVFNSFGIPRISNLGNSSYYDTEGSLHMINERMYYEHNGTVHVLGLNYSGYYDLNENLFLDEDGGYYDSKGNYYIGTVLQGYYLSDGTLKKGLNPSHEGFYDKDKNWHLFGDHGFFDVNGKYHESITDEQIGYYNASGELLQGYAIYTNGFYTREGEWLGVDQLPQSVYYTNNGGEKVGTIPYSYGYYDMYGNLHSYNDFTGYFDIMGSWHNLVSDSIGYYDRDGILIEGTNIYQDGFYDAECNFRLFKETGYYQKDGTYISITGKENYFIANKVKIAGSNVNGQGFYTSNGNYYAFNDDLSYVTIDGIKKSRVVYADMYDANSENYILFEGYFSNTEYPTSMSKNTVQFSINSVGGNKRYVDTGIKISTNAVLTYDKAKAVVHAIAVFNNCVYVEDNGYCLTIYKGRLITISDNSYISIRELKAKFIGSDMDVIVAKSRVGEKFALAEMIESNQNIGFYADSNKIAIINPLISDGGVPYISLKDVINISDYDILIKTINGNKVVIGTIKNDAKLAASDFTSFNVSLETNRMVVTINATQSYMDLSTPLKIFEEVPDEIYIPASEISLFTNKYVVLDAYSMNIHFISMSEEQYQQQEHNIFYDTAY